ncbi:MAG: cytochrome c biogenesis protein CcdA, partial [Bdellovibrionota bacterium]
MKHWTLLGALLLSSAAHAAVYTQESLPNLVRKAVIWQALLSENQIHTSLVGVSEGSLLIEVQVETRNNFNLYREHLAFSADADAALGTDRKWKLSTVKEPESFQFIDPITKKLKEGYRGQSVFLVRAEVPPGGVRSLGSDHKFPLLVDFQACNAELCLLPATLRIDIPLARSLKSSFSKAVPEDQGFVERWATMLRRLLDKDTFSVTSFLLLFVAGLVTSFTPCVYPLYPITLGIFSRWASHKSARTLELAVAYCVGMTLSYAAIGLLTAASGALFGSLTQNPVFLLGVGGVILLSALLFSGLIPFQAPLFLQNLFTRPETGDVKQLALGRQMLKAAGMGLGLGIVAAPCVGPVILALMAWLGTRFASGQASYATGFFLLSAFGAGMSLPFLVLAELTARAHALPRLGRYTPYFKHLGTVLMLAGSLFFIVPGLRLSGILKNESIQKKFQTYTLDTWPKDKWSVVDFRADWCAACLELEHETFTQYQVSPLFEKSEWNFVSVDMTVSGPEQHKIATDWNIVGLPTVLIVAPGGKICKGFELYGFEDAQAFLKRLS